MLKFKLWVWSNQWLLKYSNSNLPLELIFSWGICKFWFGHLSLSLKFDNDPISGGWDIPVLIFWDRLSLCHLIWSICRLGFGPLCLSFKFWWDTYRDCWDIPIQYYLASFDFHVFQPCWNSKIGPSVAIIWTGVRTIGGGIG